MLDVKDLRIGNLFNHFEDGILPIEEIKKDSDGFEGYYAVFRNGSIKCHVSYLSPIELTEEWLLRFGFEKVEELGYYADNKHCISDNSKDLDYWVFMPFCTNDEDCYIKIKYVHTLQNLYYALTQTELTLKDEK